MRDKAVKLFVMLRDVLIKNKVYLARSMTYITMINAAMILFLMLSRLESYGIDIEIRTWFFPLVLLGVVLMVVVGYIDERLGFFAHEQDRVSRRNPTFNKILAELEHIKHKVDDMDKRMKK